MWKYPSKAYIALHFSLLMSLNYFAAKNDMWLIFFHFTLVKSAKTWPNMNMYIMLISMTAEPKESAQVVLHWLRSFA